MSIGAQRGKQSSSQTVTQTMDPAARNLLMQIMGVAGPVADQPFDTGVGRPLGRQDLGREFGGGIHYTPEMLAYEAAKNPQAAQKPAPVAGLLGGVPQTQDTFSNSLTQADATLAGDFFGADPGTHWFDNRMAGVEEAISAAAGRAVGDQFSLAGRTGSPAHAMTLGKTVARELAPYQFGAAENQMARKSSAFQNERQRQLAASQMAMSQFDPISQFQRFVAPLLEAAGMFPNQVSSRGTGRSSGIGFSISRGDLIGNKGGG